MGRQSFLFVKGNMEKKQDNGAKYLDLDAVQADVQLTVKLGGIEHELVPVSVGDFVKNTKMIQQLEAASDDPEKHLTIIMDMLKSAFPTMTTEILNKLTLKQLEALRNVAFNNNGSQEVTQNAAKDAQAANPQAAGQ